jgi:hypothetical protein
MPPMCNLSRPAHCINFGIEALSATTGYVLVDLSDTTNFKHIPTGEIHVLGMSVSTERAATGVYDLHLGVIIRVDATNADTKWFEIVRLETGTDRVVQFYDYTLGGRNPEGVNLRVTSGATARFLSNQGLTNSTVFQTDVNLTSPVGSTTPSGLGDLVLYAEEVSGTGTVDFNITLFYETA